MRPKNAIVFSLTVAAVLLIAPAASGRDCDRGYLTCISDCSWEWFHCTDDCAVDYDWCSDSLDYLRDLLNDPTIPEAQKVGIRADLEAGLAACADERDDCHVACEQDMDDCYDECEFNCHVPE